MDPKINQIIKKIGILLVFITITSFTIELKSGIAEGDLPDWQGGNIAAQYQASIINPVSAFVLYGRDDGTSWLNDAVGNKMIVDGRQPRLSPDGRYIVVRRWDIEHGDLYVHALETKQDTLVLDNSDLIVGFSWSMDGNRIYFDYSCVIYAIDRDGSNLEVIIEDWPPDADPSWFNCYNDAPDVNPVDGRLAWHSEKYGIGLSTGDGQNRHWLFNSTPGDYSPRWSSDGEWIAFIRHSTHNLYKIRPDGIDLTQLTFLSAPDTMSFWTGAWEAGGNWLIAPAMVNGFENLYAVATDGSGRIIPFYTGPGSTPLYVGSAGSWDFHSLDLPLVLK